MAKIKDIAPEKKSDKITALSTILIIVISIISVASVFVMYLNQTEVNKYSQYADDRYTLMSIIESDIERIVDNDRQLQMLAFTYHQNLILANSTIQQMRLYNITVDPGSYMQHDLDEVAMQAVIQIQLLNALINESYAYQWWDYWTLNIGYIVQDANFTYKGENNYLIVNYYTEYEAHLDNTLKYWLNETYGNQTTVLDINIVNWEIELYNDTTIVDDENYGRYTTRYNYGLPEDRYIILWGNSYYNLQNEADYYQSTSETYSYLISLQATSLILLAIGAVIVTFLVSIYGKKYLWISLIIGAIVTGVGIGMFCVGIINLTQISVLEPWEWMFGMP